MSPRLEDEHKNKSEDNEQQKKDAFPSSCVLLIPVGVQ
jgi:hypothetical protein